MPFPNVVVLGVDPKDRCPNRSELFLVLPAAAGTKPYLIARLLRPPQETLAPIGSPPTHTALGRRGTGAVQAVKVQGRCAALRRPIPCATRYCRCARRFRRVEWIAPSPSTYLLFLCASDDISHTPDGWLEKHSSIPCHVE